jgi:hypothetical protein
VLSYGATGRREPAGETSQGGPPGTPRPFAETLRITDFGIGGVAVDYMRTSNPAGLSMLSMMNGCLET